MHQFPKRLHVKGQVKCLVAKVGPSSRRTSKHPQGKQNRGKPNHDTHPEFRRFRSGFFDRKHHSLLEQKNSGASNAGQFFPKKTSRLLPSGWFCSGNLSQGMLIVRRRGRRETRSLHLARPKGRCKWQLAQ